MDAIGPGDSAAADAIEIARLANMPALEYDRELKPAAKRMKE